MLMAERITAYLLLLLICGPVAAEPVNEPAKTAAVHPPAAPKEVKSTPAGPANGCSARCLDLLLSLPVRLAHMREVASLEVYLCQLMAPTGK